MIQLILTPSSLTLLPSPSSSTLSFLFYPLLPLLPSPFSSTLSFLFYPLLSLLPSPSSSTLSFLFYPLLPLLPSPFSSTLSFLFYPLLPLLPSPSSSTLSFLSSPLYTLIPYKSLTFTSECLLLYPSIGTWWLSLGNLLKPRLPSSMLSTLLSVEACNPGDSIQNAGNPVMVRREESVSRLEDSRGRRVERMTWLRYCASGSTCTTEREEEVPTLPPNRLRP